MSSSTDSAAKAVAKLRNFREKLYTVHFKDNELLDKLQVGINHLIIYPHPTQEGRKFLACLVAGMWNPENYAYFDVYRSIREGYEEGVSFALDHAGNEYHNSNFTRYNSARSREHLHPVDAGGYHTHFCYGWNFPGVMAIYSILLTGMQHLEDGPSKESYLKNIHQFIQEVSMDIGDVLTSCLELSDAPEIAVALSQINEGGIFSLAEMDKAEFKPLKLSQESRTKIRFKLYEQVGAQADDVLKILDTTLFEINFFRQNYQKLSQGKALTGGLYKDCHHSSTLKHLFELGCCLTQPQNQYAEVTTDHLLMRIADLKEDPELSSEGKLEMELLRSELALRDLKEQSKLDPSEVGKTVLESARTQGVVVTDKTDKEMRGYRERVALALPQNFTFNGQAMTQGRVFTEGAIDRSDMLKALKLLGNDSVEHSEAEYLAANMVVEPLMLCSPRGNVIGRLSEQDWPVLSKEVVHRMCGGKVYMTTHRLDGLLAPNCTVSMKELAGLEECSALVQEQSSKKADCETVIVEGSWFSSSEKPVCAARDANVFGKLGAFIIKHEQDIIELPVTCACSLPSEMLEKFGAKLHKAEDTIHYQGDTELYGIEYEFKQGYIENYVLNPEKGGGLFVEKHDFPHFFTPVEQTCSGGLILGRPLPDNKFEFISVQIPYGYTLEIAPGVIHGDSFFQGKYLITLTAAKEADSVLWRTTEDEVQAVSQHTLFGKKDKRLVAAASSAVVKDVRIAQTVY